MSYAVVFCLVLLLSATSVVGTVGECHQRQILIHRQRETHKTLVRGYTTADGDDSTTECVSQEELANVKAEMERRATLLAECHCWHSQGPLLFNQYW